MDDLQAEFKAWAADHLGQGYPLTMDEGTYAHPVTRWAFKAFQAGRATRSTAQQGEERDAALEEAALACEAIESDRRDAYKGRGKYEPFNPCRADPYVDAVSDGAGRCADAIRALKGHPADAAEGKEG